MEFPAGLISVVCIVDAKHFKQNNTEKILLKQLKLSTIVIINKRSDISKEEEIDIKKEIETHNPESNILLTDFCKIDFSKILGSRFFTDKFNLSLLSKKNNK